MDNAGQRQRSRCVIANDNKKHSTTNDVEKLKENKEAQKHFTSSFLKLDNKDIKKQRESLMTTEFKTNFNKPKFSGVKKEFYSKNSKVIISFE